MSTSRLRKHLVALALGALALGCNAGGDDRDGDGTGITVGVTASEQTRAATGIMTWDVAQSAVGVISVVARGADGAVVVQLTGRYGQVFGVELSGHRISFDAMGNVLDDSLTMDDVVFVDRFRSDAAAALGAGGFRDAEGCMGAVGGTAPPPGGGGEGGVGGGGDDGGATGGTPSPTAGAQAACGPLQGGGTDYDLVNCGRAVCDGSAACTMGGGAPPPVETSGESDSATGESGGGEESGGEESGGESEASGGESYGGESYGGESYGGESYGGESYGGESYGGETYGGGESYGEEGYGYDSDHGLGPAIASPTTPIPTTDRSPLSVKAWNLPSAAARR